MNKLTPTFILFFSICTNAYPAEPTNSHLQWKKLLHYGAEKSRVVSKSFFLSPVGNTDYLAELRETIRLLNTRDGEHIACNFPARYQWLVNHHHNISHYDLKRCQDLNEFIKGFQKQTISLVFASEYLDNPVSSFGHTMLVFHDKDKPLLTADAVHFAAKTNEEDGFFTYTWKGLTGGYPGYFFRDPFFKKQHQYNIIEQRYLHLYTLNFTEDQIKTLIYHLYELRKATFNYYFINENCAYQIGNLLDIVGEGVSFSDVGFVLPIEVIKKFKDSYIHHQVLLPTSAIVRQLLREMPEADQAQFESFIAGNQIPDNFLSNELKYALASYYEYDFRKNRKTNPNYNKVMALNYTAPELDIESPEPLNKRDASKISLSYRKQGNQESVLLDYRPFLQDLFDIQPAHEQAFEISLLNTSLEFKNDISYIHQLDLLSIKSLSSRSRYFKPISWQFYTGLNRHNPDNELDYETEFGLGLTHKLAFISLNYAINLGIDLSSGDYYYKPNATILIALSDQIKLGLQASEKYYENNKYIDRSAYLTFSTGNHALQARYSSISPSEEEQIIVGYSHFF